MKPLYFVIASFASVVALPAVNAQLNHLRLEGPIFSHSPFENPGDRVAWFPDGNGEGEEFRFEVGYERGLIAEIGSTSEHATYRPPPGKSDWTLKFGRVEIGGEVTKFDVFNGPIDGFNIEYTGSDSLTLLSIQLFLDGSMLPDSGMPGVTQLPGMEPTAPGFTTGILRFDHGDEFLPFTVGQILATVRGELWGMVSGPDTPVTPVPEPATYSLAGAALAGAMLLGRYRRRRSANV